MARIRTIKPDFFLHEGLFDLEQETGLPIRLTYIGLWCQADREGRFRWEPRKLKAQIMPYDLQLDFSRVLDALVTRGFLVKYAYPENSNEYFGSIPTFKTHQFINNKEAASELPQMPGTSLKSNKLTREPRVSHAKTTRSHKERNGKGTNTVGGIIALYYSLFNERFGEKPTINQGKDPGILKDLIGEYGEQKISEYLTLYFKSNDQFVIDSGFSIPVFKSRVSRFVMARSQRPIKTPESINELSEENRKLWEQAHETDRKNTPNDKG